MGGAGIRVQRDLKGGTAGRCSCLRWQESGEEVCVWACSEDGLACGCSSKERRPRSRYVHGLRGVCSSTVSGVADWRTPAEGYEEGEMGGGGKGTVGLVVKSQGQDKRVRAGPALPLRSVLLVVQHGLHASYSQPYLSNAVLTPSSSQALFAVHPARWGTRKAKPNLRSLSPKLN